MNEYAEYIPLVIFVFGLAVGYALHRKRFHDESFSRGWNARCDLNQAIAEAECDRLEKIARL